MGEPAPDAHRRASLLLTGGIVVTMDDDRRVLDGGVVAVRENRIVAVGRAADLAGWTADEVVDCRGKAVLPGFVDGHTHLYQSLVRGLGEGLSIVPWLREFMWPYSIALSAQDAVAGARLGALEAVRSGITTVVDHHYAQTDVATTLAVADAIEQAGLRGAVARGMVGERSEIAARRGQPPALFRYGLADEVAITAEAMQHRPSGSRVEIWPAPINLTYTDPKLTRAAVELAREHGTRWHTHCCEGQGDPGSFAEVHGTTPVEWLSEQELLDSRATLAHSIWLTDNEIELLGAAGAGVAHNPTSNAYLASGTARIGAMADAGVALALGTDGPSCGHRQDMFEVMKQAVLAQRSATLDATVLRADETLALATRGGARYADVDGGVLAPGTLADIVVVGLDHPHLQPVHRATSTLVYSARGSDVDLTIVDGEIVYRDGAATRVDEAAVVDEARRRAAEVLARAGMTALLRS